MIQKIRNTKNYGSILCPFLLYHLQKKVVLYIVSHQGYFFFIKQIYIKLKRFFFLLKKITFNLEDFKLHKRRVQESYKDREIRNRTLTIVHPMSIFV